MSRVQGLFGDPVGTGNRGDASSQRRQRIAEPGGGQVGTDGFRTGRHRLEAMCLAPRLEMDEIGGVGPQRRGRVGRRLVRLGLGEQEGDARRRRLLTIRKACQLAGSGGAGWSVMAV